MPRTPGRPTKPPIPRGGGPRPPSEQLAAILRGSGLTAYAIGKLSGVDGGMIWRFLKGERDLKLSTVDRIAAALGIDLVERSRGRARPKTALAAASYDLGIMGSDGHPSPLDVERPESEPSGPLEGPTPNAIE